MEIEINKYYKVKDKKYTDIAYVTYKDHARVYYVVVYTDYILPENYKTKIYNMELEDFKKITIGPFDNLNTLEMLYAKT